MKLRILKRLGWSWKPWLGPRYLNGRRLWWGHWALEWTYKSLTIAQYLDGRRR